MSTRLWCAFSVGVLFYILSFNAYGEGGHSTSKIPRHRLVYSELLAARINPLGLVNELAVGYRLKLFDRPGALFEDTHLTIQASTYITPADTELGPMVVFQPLAVLELSAKVSFYGTFGTFGILQSFRSPNEDSSDTRQDERADQGLDYTPVGLMVTLSARLQAKVGPIALRNTSYFFYCDLELKDQHTVFYHSTLDMLFPDGGWGLKNELELLYVSTFDLILGVQYAILHAFYPDSIYPVGEPTENINTPIHLFGPLAVYTFFDRPGSARLDSISAFAIVQWYAKHRYRTGDDTPAALPLIIFGAAARGDFLPY
jgi:hypothetical protein